MQSLTAQQLMAICDRFWKPGGTAGYGEFVMAYNELATRGPEIREWCCRLLNHPDYDARECAAFLLGQLGSHRQLGEAKDAVISQLGALIRRPIEEDPKEAQAIDAAIMALAAIGSPAGVPHLRAVLLSEDDYLIGDTQWTAADALGKLVGQSFLDAPDPVRAAQQWLSLHPEG